MKRQSDNQANILKLCLVAGARPNFMKIAPLIRAIKKHNEKALIQGLPNIDFYLVHTGQHYDYEMSSIFFEELAIPEPDIFLNIGSANHGEQTGKIMIAFEEVLLNRKTDIVVVVGDVNSTIACALVASKLHVSVAHVEAGLRSFDRSMPEEINRLLTDQISDYLFTPSPDGNENLAREGISSEKVYLAGDIMIDNLFFNLPKAQKTDIFKKLGLEIEGAEPAIKDYALLTLHRPANVDDKASLVNILNAVQEISKELPVIFPMHPRTEKMLSAFNLDKKYDFNNLCNLQDTTKISNSINTIKPLGYLDFLALMSKAKIVLTDSGGIQEETTVLGVQCLTLRDTTERPITVTVGTNILVHDSTEKIINETKRVLQGDKKGKCPEIWDGKAAERIVAVLCGSEKQSIMGGKTENHENTSNRK